MTAKHKLKKLLKLKAKPSKLQILSCNDDPPLNDCYIFLNIKITNIVLCLTESCTDFFLASTQFTRISMYLKCHTKKICTKHEDLPLATYVILHRILSLLISLFPSGGLTNVWHIIAIFILARTQRLFSYKRKMKKDL